MLGAICIGFFAICLIGLVSWNFIKDAEGREQTTSIGKYKQEEANLLKTVVK